MKSRLLALCMLFVLIVALVPGVMAQDTTICGNLSADDCTALTTAFTNTGAAGSGAFTLTSTIDIQSDDPTQAAKVDITADGKFSGVKPMSMTDMTAMSADPTAALAKFTDSLKTFSGTLNLTLGLPTSAASMTGGQPLTLNLILVNGVGYLDFSKLPATITPMLQAYKIPTGWAGLDFIDTLTNAAPMLSGMTGGSTTAPAAGSTSAADMAKVQAMFTKYLQYTHDGDTYTGTVDLKGMLTDPDFQTMMKSDSTTKDLTAEQQAAIDSLDDATFQVAFTLAGDKLGELNLTIDLPSTTMAAFAAASKTSESDAKPPTAINVTLDLKYSGLGEAQTIAAPDGAPVAKFADLMTLMQGSMGSSS